MALIEINETTIIKGLLLSDQEHFKMVSDNRFELTSIFGEDLLKHNILNRKRQWL